MNLNTKNTSMNQKSTLWFYFYFSGNWLHKAGFLQVDIGYKHNKDKQG